jgi:hypothetical protein
MMILERKKNGANTVYVIFHNFRCLVRKFGSKSRRVRPRVDANADARRRDDGDPPTRRDYLAHAAGQGGRN